MYNSLEKKKLKIEVKILLQNAFLIKSSLGPFTKPLLSSALQILTSLTHISGVHWTTLKCQVSAIELKANKSSYDFKTS